MIRPNVSATQKSKQALDRCGLPSQDMVLPDIEVPAFGVVRGPDFDIGPKRIVHILECLHTFYADPRYRPSPWLKRRVMLGLLLNAPEGTAV